MSGCCRLALYSVFMIFRFYFWKEVAAVSYEGSSSVPRDRLLPAHLISRLRSWVEQEEVGL